MENGAGYSIIFMPVSFTTSRYYTGSTYLNLVDVITRPDQKLKHCSHCKKYKKKVFVCKKCQHNWCYDCAKEHHQCGFQRYPDYKYSVEKEPGTHKTKYIHHNTLVGIEFETGFRKRSYVDSVLESELPQSYGFHYDGNGREVTTPPASLDKLLSHIKFTCKLLKGLGAAPSNGDGLHVHIDGRRNSARQNYHIVETYRHLEPILYRLLNNYRRECSTCRSINYEYNNRSYVILSGKETKSEQRRKFENWDKYRGLGVGNLTDYGTIELRYHQGTVDAKEIEKWIGLNLYLMNWAKYHYDPKTIKFIHQKEQEAKEEGTLKGYAIPVFKSLGVPDIFYQYIRERIKLHHPQLWH